MRDYTEYMNRIGFLLCVIPKGCPHGVVVGFKENFVFGDTNSPPPFVFMTAADPRAMEKSLDEIAMMLEVQGVDNYVFSVPIHSRRSDPNLKKSTVEGVEMGVPNARLFIVNLGHGDAAFFITHLSGVVEIQPPTNDPLVTSFANLHPDGPERTRVMEKIAEYGPEEMKAWLEKYEFVQSDSRKAADDIERVTSNTRTLQ